MLLLQDNQTVLPWNITILNWIHHARFRYNCQTVICYTIQEGEASECDVIEIINHCMNYTHICNCSISWREGSGSLLSLFCEWKHARPKKELISDDPTTIQFKLQQLARNFLMIEMFLPWLFIFFEEILLLGRADLSSANSSRAFGIAEKSRCCP